ncbi:TVP38/TMEM64 family protein [Neobacillus sp. FSL H8-0543]|uniref:TVP38/TMEM64 family protein n=1 Tax=Neobacillus sp. FSL H8-0543 TaxID=2954672 RepID=UPI0031581E9E
MKTILRGLGSLISTMVLFLLIGLSLALLMIQSSWVNVRFDSEYIVTISILTGFWLFFLKTFMNAKKLAIWESVLSSSLAVIVSLGVIGFITISHGSLSILPAYVVRKAFFMEKVITLGGMNNLLMIILPIGFAVLVFTIVSRNNTNVEFNHGWNQISGFKRFGIMSFFGIIALFLLIYLGQGEIRNTINQAIMYLKDADVEGFKDYLLSFGPLAAVISGLMMVFQSIIAPLPAFAITFANGLLFGWGLGAILSWSSAMIGAILCFYLAKVLGRPVVEKIVTKKALTWWDQFFGRYGKHAIFIARLVPIVSFDLVSYAAGVTSISFWQFFWATGLGQLPATILYSYLGENATSTVQILFFLFTIVIALAVIGMILRPKLQGWNKAKQGEKVNGNKVG